MADRIYLDNSTQTKPSPLALQAAVPFYEEHYGSIASPHQMGQELSGPLEDSVKQIKELFGASQEDQFVFTSSGAEAVSGVVYSAYCEQTKKHGKNHFVARAIDEAATILSISRLEDDGVFLHLAPCSKRGYVTEEALIESISPRTAMVSLSWGSGLTGVIQPLEDLAAICKKRGIWLHVDASCVVGKLDICFAELPCDLLTFHGNALCAPLGTGGIFAKKAISLHPLIAGADLNVPMLVALGAACTLAKQTQSLYCTEVARLRSLLEEGIKKAYPEAHVFFEEEERLPHVTSIVFPGIHAELLAFTLNRKGVFVTMGGGPFQLLEHVLTRCDIDEDLARTALSFTLSKDTQEAEIERAIQIIAEITKRMRRLSYALYKEQV